MKNILRFNIIFLCFLFLVPLIIYAYSYTGHKWPSYPVSIDVTDLSFPSSWISPLANAMTTWNNASSPFYFNSGSGGHMVKASNSGSGLLAITSVSVSGSTITDCDLTVNTFYSWSTSGEVGKYDVQNMLTHELGHWLSLDDLYSLSDSEKTMYHASTTGETKKRTLDQDDLNGINAIYP